MKNGDWLDLGIAQDVGLASAKLVSLLLPAMSKLPENEPANPTSQSPLQENLTAEILLAGRDQLLPLYRYLEPKRNWASHREIAEHLNIDETSVAKYLRRLRDEGVKLDRKPKRVMLKEKIGHK
jgi:biotin operon repressor